MTWKSPTKALNEDLNALGSLHMDCMTKARDFEAETTSHDEELKALAMANKATSRSIAPKPAQLSSLANCFHAVDVQQQECNTQPCRIMIW